MNLNDSIIAQIEIDGLHGDRNITSTFKGPLKILVDENGSGKTTFLNILVGLLQNKQGIINRYEFDEIRFRFTSGELINFTGGYFEDIDDPVVKEILKHIPREVVENLVESISELPYSKVRSIGLLDIVAEEVGISPRGIYDRLRRNPSLKRMNILAHQMDLLEFDDIEKDESNQFDLNLFKLRDLFPYRVLYFPTYRLVEENLHYLDYERRSRKHDRQLIQFGMEDVKERWDAITEDIRRSSLQWFSRINGRMLDELTDGIRPDSIDYESIEQQKALEIVLARSGDNISPHSRTRILELVKSGDIKQNEYNSLAYFLSNLIEIYEQQQVIDDAIKKFVTVANGYLTDKEIYYDETEMVIQVINTRSHKAMQLDKLSSGEKQIISIFTKLYLELDNPQPYAIFFDEPELSLSMGQSQW